MPRFAIAVILFMVSNHFPARVWIAAELGGRAGHHSDWMADEQTLLPAAGATGNLFRRTAS